MTLIIRRRDGLPFTRVCLEQFKREKLATNINELIDASNDHLVRTKYHSAPLDERIIYEFCNLQLDPVVPDGNSIEGDVDSAPNSYRGCWPVANVPVTGTVRGAIGLTRMLGNASELEFRWGCCMDETEEEFIQEHYGSTKKRGTLRPLQHIEF